MAVLTVLLLAPFQGIIEKLKRIAVWQADIASGEDETAITIMEKCSFDGCEELVCEADKESPDRMHFCQKHHDQLAQYVKENAIPKIIGFWVKANGGAKKLASTF